MLRPNGHNIFLGRGDRIRLVLLAHQLKLADTCKQVSSARLNIVTINSHWLFMPIGSNPCSSSIEIVLDQKAKDYFYGRGDRIRTCDPAVPNRVRYQLRYSPEQLYGSIAYFPLVMVVFCLVVSYHICL